MCHDMCYDTRGKYRTAICGCVGFFCAMNDNNSDNAAPPVSSPESPPESPPAPPGGWALPNAVYSKRTRTRRIAEGGETIGGTLRPEAGQALRVIMESGTYPSKLAAIEAALIREHDRLRRRRARAGLAEIPAAPLIGVPATGASPIDR